jgi:alpha/beta superfamily hydrolase
MVYFMHYLTLPDSVYSDPSPYWDDEPCGLSPIPSQALPALQSALPPPIEKRHAVLSTQILQYKSLILLAGYSYGALVTTQLPALSSIISLFHAPAKGTALSEIKLRAQQLARQQNNSFINLAEVLKTQSPVNISKTATKLSRGRNLQAETTSISRIPSAPASVRLGGEETDPDIRRASHDSHNRISLSFESDRLRKSIDRVRSLARRPDFRTQNASHRMKSSDSSRHSSSGNSSQSMEINSPLESEMEKIGDHVKREDDIDIESIKVSYLLISPLQGLITKLATMWTKTPQSRTKSSFKAIDAESNLEKKLVENETLAIFGDQDLFSSGKKLRLWADRLGSEPNSRFRYVEIDGAGHFWHEYAGQMRENVMEFISGL